jgi:L-erythro-3,5-diaminohexanoate dehydrogenase
MDTAEGLLLLRRMRLMAFSVGLDRVVEPAGVLPQAAWRLDPRPPIAADEVRIRVERLNLDAASFRQLSEKHGGDGAAVRAEVLEIVRTRGTMHNPVTGSGGMLIGVVDEVGPASPLAVKPGDRVATLVSLTLTPLEITDDLRKWDGTSEQVPAEGAAILFGRSVVGVLPADLPPELALAVYDVCGAPALTDRVVRSYGRNDVTVAVLGGAGKSGSLALTAARLAGARTAGIVVDEAERATLSDAGLADVVAVADARNPVEVSKKVTEALGGPATITVVCVDVPGCEHGAILSTADGGTVIFFSMATSFPAAALGAEGLAADVTMLIGNGYVPGHAAFAVDLVRRVPAVRALFEARLAGH